MFCCGLQIQDAIEALDAERLCESYWQGKADRMNHAAGIPVAHRAKSHATKSHGTKSHATKSRKKRVR